MRPSFALALVGLLGALAACSFGEGAEFVATTQVAEARWNPSAPGDPNPLVALPEDPLGLAGDGWWLNKRSTTDRYQIIDAYGCNELIDWRAKALLAATYESYTAPAAQGLSTRWLDVTYIDYGDPDLLAERLVAYANVDDSCSEEGDTSLTAWSPPSDQADYDSFGFDRGAMRYWVVTDHSTLAVIFNGTAHSVESGPSLNERAAELLEQLAQSTTTDLP